ncbi:hypothetical protein [Roseovarius indicus]|uniref:hypothetical protein n=1 Tax=Roseovarius indicus TaxID=540747 RepID=UPI004059092E
MTLSNHRRIELHQAVSQEPDRLRVMSGCVILVFGDLFVSVRRRDWHVTVPGRPEEAAYLESLGVADRAKLAIERGEGPASGYVPHASRARLVAGQEAMRRALA